MNTLISLKDVGYRFGARDILTHINLDINQGDFWAITGPNGGGKTTLLRLILRLLQPTSGKIIYNTETCRQGEAEKCLFPIGYLPQKNTIDSRFPITVEEVIASGLLGEEYYKKLQKPQLREQIDDAISLVELDEKRTSPIGNLSGGQLQRALLGRALVCQPKLLVLDEPLSYVDKHFEERIYHILAKLAETTTILLVSHEMNVIDRMANRHAIVDHELTLCHALHHGPIEFPCDACK